MRSALLPLLLAALAAAHLSQQPGRFTNPHLKAIVSDPLVYAGRLSRSRSPQSERERERKREREERTKEQKRVLLQNSHSRSALPPQLRDDL